MTRSSHLARLSRLALDDSELDHLAGQLDVILGAVARIAEVASRRRASRCRTPSRSRTSPAPTSSTPSLDRDAVLAGAPAAEDGRFRVPQILVEE